MSTKRKPQQKRRITSPVRHKRPGLFVRLFQHVPGWAWWTGGMAVVALYVCFFYYIFVSPFGFRWRALYGDVSYPEGYEVHGIDISHHQGKIDWDELREKGLINGYPVRFVMIKATEGASRSDDKFRHNFHQAREHGFIRGAYHFYSVHSSAEQQAAFYIRTVKLEKGDLPPVLDVEHKPKKQSDEDFKKSILQWLRIVEKHYGVSPIIYSYHKFKERYLSDAAFDQYPYWIAHYYVDKVEFAGQWMFWQHTDAGRVPGIEGDVDFNIYNGSFHDLRKMTIGGQEDAETLQDE